MTFVAVIQVVARELGPDVAAAIDRILRRELGGERLYIPARQAVTPDLAHDAAPYQPRRAAAILDVHPTTVYRALRQRRPLIR